MFVKEQLQLVAGFLRIMCTNKVLTVLVALTLVQSVTSIKCWQCRSDSDPKCADPFDNKTLPITDCDIVTLPHLVVHRTEEYKDVYGLLQTRTVSAGRPLRPNMCRKVRQKVEGQWRTIRGCAFLGQPGEGTGNEHHCLIRQGTHDIYVEYCTCDSKDGCNGSDRQVASSMWSLVLLASVTAFGLRWSASIR